MDTGKSLFVTTEGSLAGRKGPRVRGVFLILLGFILIGIGASFYYGALDLGSLTKSGAAQETGNPLAYIPVGLGAAMIVGGIVLALLDRRLALRAPSSGR